MMSSSVGLSTSWTITIDLQGSTMTGYGGEQVWPMSSSLVLPGVVSAGHLTGDSSQVVVDRSASLSGDLYYRLRAGRIEISDSLSALCPRPTMADVSIPVLIGLSAGVRPAPDQTHLNEVRRLPPLSLARIGTDGVSVRCAPGALEVQRPPRYGRGAGGLEASLRRSLEEVAPASALVAASGGLASQAVVNLLGDMGRPVPALSVHQSGTDVVITSRQLGDLSWPEEELLSRLRTSASWPAYPGRHLPIVYAAAAAHDLGADALVTGRYLRVLGGTGPEECRTAVGRFARLGLEPLEGLRQGRPWRRQGQDTHDPSSATVRVPPWMPPEGQRTLHEAAMASRAGWANWFRSVAPRAGRLLWALTDPALGWVADVSREVGVNIGVPALHAEALPTLLSLPLRQRGGPDHGRFVDAPELRRLAHGARHRADGGARSRAAAVEWAHAAARTSRPVLSTGYLAQAGLLDPTGVDYVLRNPFLRAEHASVLRQLASVDAWLSTVSDPS